MTVIPFPRANARQPLAFALGARFDLRLGAPAAGVVRGMGDEEHSFSGLARMLRAARMTWRARSAMGQLSLVLPDDVADNFDADTLDAATAEKILSVFLTTAALGDRYAARRDRLAQLDISTL